MACHYSEKECVGDISLLCFNGEGLFGVYVRACVCVETESCRALPQYLMVGCP